MTGIWDREKGDWMSSALNDMRGREFQVGDKFAKAYQSGRSVNLQICTVTRIDDGKMYADGSKVAIRFPGRCLIVTPLFDESGVPE